MCELVGKQCLKWKTQNSILSKKTKWIWLLQILMGDVFSFTNYDIAIYQLILLNKLNYKIMNYVSAKPNHWLVKLNTHSKQKYVLKATWNSRKFLHQDATTNKSKWKICFCWQQQWKCHGFLADKDQKLLERLKTFSFPKSQATVAICRMAIEQSLTAGSKQLKRFDVGH